MTHHDEVPLPTARQMAALLKGLLRQRSAGLLWLAGLTAAAAIGTLAPGALALVYERTPSAAALSAAVSAALLAVVLFRLPADSMSSGTQAGVWLSVGYGLCAILTLAVVALRDQPAALLLTLFVLSAFSLALRRQAAALICADVAEDERGAAASVLNLTLAAGCLLGMALVVPLLARMAGAVGMCVGAALLFASAAGLSALLRAPEVAAVRPPNGPARALAAECWRDVRLALRITRGDWRLLRALGCLALVVALVAMSAVMGPVFAVSVLRGRAWDAALLAVPYAAGFGLAVAAMRAGMATYGLARPMTSGLLIVGGVLLLLGAAKTGSNYVVHNLLGRVIDTRRAVVDIVPLALLLLGALGAGCGVLWFAASRSLLQWWPDERRDRLQALTVTLTAAAALPPAALVGGAVDALGVNKTMAVLGVFWLAAGAIAWRFEHSDAATDA